MSTILITIFSYSKSLRFFFSEFLAKKERFRPVSFCSASFRSGHCRLEGCRSGFSSCRSGSFRPGSPGFSSCRSGSFRSGFSSCRSGSFRSGSSCRCMPLVLVSCCISWKARQKQGSNTEPTMKQTCHQKNAKTVLQATTAASSAGRPVGAASPGGRPVGASSAGRPPARPAASSRLRVGQLELLQWLAGKQPVLPPQSPSCWLSPPGDSPVFSSWNLPS